MKISNMTRTKDANPVATGAIGAAAGAVIVGATSVLLTNRSARRKIADKLKDIGDYAQDAMDAVSDVAKDSQLRRVKFAGVKDGKSLKLKKGNSKKR